MVAAGGSAASPPRKGRWRWWERARWWVFHHLVCRAFRREFRLERHVLLEQALAEVVMKLGAMVEALPPEAHRTRKALLAAQQELLRTL